MCVQWADLLKYSSGRMVRNRWNGPRQSSYAQIYRLARKMWETCQRTRFTLKWIKSNLNTLRRWNSNFLKQKSHRGDLRYGNCQFECKKKQTKVLWFMKFRVDKVPAADTAAKAVAAAAYQMSADGWRRRRRRGQEMRIDSPADLYSSGGASRVQVKALGVRQVMMLMAISRHSSALWRCADDQSTGLF